MGRLRGGGGVCFWGGGDGGGGLRKRVGEGGIALRGIEYGVTFLYISGDYMI